MSSACGAGGTGSGGGGGGGGIGFAISVSTDGIGSVRVGNSLGPLRKSISSMLSFCILINQVLVFTSQIMSVVDNPGSFSSVMFFAPHKSRLGSLFWRGLNEVNALGSCVPHTSVDDGKER